MIVPVLSKFGRTIYNPQNGQDLTVFLVGITKILQAKDLTTIWWPNVFVVTNFGLTLGKTNNSNRKKEPTGVAFHTKALPLAIMLAFN